MEYWEGFFLGPFWTDSDYKDRRHKTLFIGISLIIFALMVLQILMPGKISKLFVFPIQVNFILGFLLLIGLPFLASIKSCFPYSYFICLYITIFIFISWVYTIVYP